MKTYLIIGVCTLVVITSVSVYSDFFLMRIKVQIVVFEKESTKLIFKEDRLDQLKEDKKFLLEDLDTNKFITRKLHYCKRNLRRL